jgi:flavin reductase (DIM6/NTAB) family NADH-FMN oxidoreductase RutF
MKEGNERMPRVDKIDQPPELWDRLFANVGQLAMITSADGEGRVNAATFATCVRVVHEPVHIAFTTSTYKDTWRNIQATGQFTINLAAFDRGLLEKACVLGLPFAAGVNEIEKAGLTAIPARRVKPPRIAECHRHFECEVVWTKDWVGRVMIVGNVLAASVDADCVDERGYLVWERVKPVQYCGAPYQKYVDEPPYKHMFVAAYETMSVGTPYDGPEAAEHNKIVKDELHFR